MECEGEISGRAPAVPRSTQHPVRQFVLTSLARVILMNDASKKLRTLHNAEIDVHICRLPDELLQLV